MLRQTGVVNTKFLFLTLYNKIKSWFWNLLVCPSVVWALTLETIFETPCKFSMLLAWSILKIVYYLWFFYTERQNICQWKSHLNCILMMVHNFKHNRIGMHLLSKIIWILNKILGAKKLLFFTEFHISS